MEEKEGGGGGGESGDQAFSSGESEKCVALVFVKGLLRRISHHNRVSPPERTCRMDRLGVADGSRPARPDPTRS